MKDRRFKIYKSLSVFLFIVSCLLSVGIVTFAQTAPPATPPPAQYKLLEPLPFVSGEPGQECKTEDGSPCATGLSYLPGLFRLVIGIAGALAVVRLIYAGIIYMSTDAIGEKNDAKKIISEAFWGLGLAIAAWVILYTINPKLTEINFNIERQELSTSTAPTSGGPLPLPPGSCTGCVQVTVPHKLPPNGCAAPGPCVINAGLHAKLVSLNKLQPLLVTESFPPTRSHQNPCHSSGTCVDATIASANEANIKKFIENASKVGLNAQFETVSEKRAEDIRKATGLTQSQVYYVAGITGEHFSIYNGR